MAKNSYSYTRKYHLDNSFDLYFSGRSDKSINFAGTAYGLTGVLVTQLFIGEHCSDPISLHAYSSICRYIDFQTSDNLHT